MNIEDKKERMIFRNDYNGKALYNIGISHQKQDKTWENGTMNCSFPKGTDIPNKTKIKIINAWVDFYIKDKVTHPYIFINKYEIVDSNKTTEENGSIPQNVKTEYDSIKSDVQLNDDDLPF